jgi:hypothetical protein
MMTQRISTLLLSAAIATAPMAMHAQTAPHQAGTVKSTSATGLTLTTTANQDYTVTVPDTAKVLVVAPGSTDLKSATAGSLADVAPGDRAIVTGTAGDTGTTLAATRIILMKASAIAQTHQAEEAAWTQGGGGIVKSVDLSSGNVIISRGMKPITILTTPKTIVRHYSGDSVRFQDATLSSLAAIHPGDQLRVRGAKSADGSTITADEIVAGTFRNYSGLITSIDAANDTITLKDLTTKKTVTVSVTANSDVRRIAPQMATMIAARMKAPAAASSPGGPGNGAQRAGADLSQLLSRLPTETLAGLKPGDAVMIVANSPAADSTKSTAVTLLVGVDPILTAAPTGDMTLSPWSVGGGAPDMGGLQ